MLEINIEILHQIQPSSASIVNNLIVEGHRSLKLLLLAIFQSICLLWLIKNMLESVFLTAEAITTIYDYKDFKDFQFQRPKLKCSLE